MDQKRDILDGFQASGSIKGLGASSFERECLLTCTWISLVAEISGDWIFLRRKFRDFLDACWDLLLSFAFLFSLLPDI